MQIIQGTTDFQLHGTTAVALGKFDGVHIGHRRLLEEVLEQRGRGLHSCVFTFHPSPAALFGRSDGRVLSTVGEKRRIFERMGVETLIEFPLNGESADIEPEDFVRTFLYGKIGARYIAAGEDVSFGRRGAGDAGLLCTLGRELGLEVRFIEKVCAEGEAVSSSRIRNDVEAGELERAGRLLGAPYTVAGKVAAGNRIGRTLGFPTVNLLPDPNKILPPPGVYYSQVRCGEERFRAVSNVGCKPTVSKERIMGVESHLYDFDREIYGEEIEVALYAFRRAERKFPDVEALREQLAADIEAGRRYHARHIGENA
ncbi:MAG: riboflavin biosynthesis protein RibF [Muribaculum sp.]|nr:riboflavin biosynthesis protein RibF [Muribaculum sp.]